MSEISHAHPFLRGGGEMGARMRAYNWAETPLGDPDDWPETLQTMVSVILNSALLGTVLWGPELRLLYNDAYAPALAGRHPMALGRPIADVWGPVWDQIAPQFLPVMETGEPIFDRRLPLLIEREGRSDLTYWTYSVSPIRGPDERIVGLLNQAIEITGEVRAERDRAEAEERLRNLNVDLELRVAERTQERDRLWRNTQDVQLICDTLGMLKAVNPAFTRILGWTPDDVIGRNVFDFIIPDEEASTGALRQASEQQLLAFENCYRHKDGSVRWFAWVASPEADLVYASGRHITAEKEQAEDLRNAAEALRQSQKMEAVGQLTGGLAHDFNNLLTGIMGNLELLQMRVARGRIEDLDRFINAAQGAGRRAATLTQRLLAFSRRQTLDPKRTDVNRLLVGLHDLLHRTVGATVDIKVVQAAGLWTTQIDGPQLENALINLCVNGRDAMPEGGKLTIETANETIDDRIGRERDLPAGQYVSVCVTDTGTGMSEETIRRSFEPFFTTKPMGQGTGLGLSMIYGFARQSGGQIRIHSELGQGTTVCIYLPRHHGEAESDTADVETTSTQKAEGQTVLVVEDEATIRHVIDEALDDLGYTVIGAADGAAGIKVLQSGARIELLITDVGLPNGMNGRQVADEARRLRPGLRVLFITGFVENAAVGNGHLEPGMELLTKPFTLKAFSTKVADILNRPALS
nr:PAS domain-containing sensor histidine kinase [Sphingomonas sp. CFBP 8765]